MADVMTEVPEYELTAPMTEENRAEAIRALDLLHGQSHFLLQCYRVTYFVSENVVEYLRSEHLV